MTASLPQIELSSSSRKTQRHIMPRGSHAFFLHNRKIMCLHSHPGTVRRGRLSSGPQSHRQNRPSLFQMLSHRIDAARSMCRAAWQP